MPEGDTIFRAAQTLRTVLKGGTITDFEAPRLAGVLPRPGDVIADVEARGKHLLVHVEGRDGRPDLSVRTHLRMTGSWHTYRPGERWQKPRRQARLVIETSEAVAVCFNAPVVEVLPTGRVDRHPELRRLGPDLARSDADLDEAVARLSRLDADTEIGVALLDQRVACGVGNVYKSEALHACGVDPFATVGELDAATRRRLLETASRQLRANLTGHPRTTVREGLAVYGRAGDPCRTCGAPIAVRRQGDHARVTYWCATCQPPHPERPDHPTRPA